MICIEIDNIQYKLEEDRHNGCKECDFYDGKSCVYNSPCIGFGKYLHFEKMKVTRMATIEERAREYCLREKVTNFDCLHAYAIGATDQQNIDIDRAWQWMRQHIKLIGSEMELHSKFVKAMKDEKN